MSIIRDPLPIMC